MVHFQYDEAIQNVEHGAIVSEPTAPEKDDKIDGVSTTGPIPEHDFIFRGWYIDPELTTAFDFNTPITGNITLYANGDYLLLRQEPIMI